MFMRDTILSFGKLPFHEKYKIKMEDQRSKSTTVNDKIKKDLTERLNMKNVKRNKKFSKKTRRNKFWAREIAGIKTHEGETVFSQVRCKKKVRCSSYCQQLYN